MSSGNMSPTSTAFGEPVRKARFSLLHPVNLLVWVLQMLYNLAQMVIIALFKTKPPRSPNEPAHPYGRIAVIGAGLTGVSSAAHCISHGFDVVIYDKSDTVGGIWARVNKTSGLQLNSLLYRFHPGVKWSKTFPHRDEILGEIGRIWREYQLEPRTKLNTEVKRVRRAGSSTDPNEGGHARWIINDGEDGEFDAVIVTIGTCGPPHRLHMDGTEKFKGKVYHSSELEDADLEDKEVVVIGSGASGVEAAELAMDKKAKRTTVLARDDKWIIPRNILFDTAISAQPFGRQMPLSWVPETLLKVFHYQGAKDLVPSHTSLFEGTPIVNDEFLRHVREKRVSYVHGDTLDIQKDGVRVNVRQHDSKPNDPGEEKIFRADVVIFATGYKKPSIDFLPKDLFPEGYGRPNLYLQNFSTEDWSILMTNSAYLNAIGTVGHFHIGIYTRILLVFLLDKKARPPPKDMKLWVDAVRWLKQNAKGGALGFFTYMELMMWLLLFHMWRFARLKWILFIMNGWGSQWTEVKEES